MGGGKDRKRKLAKSNRVNYAARRIYDGLREKEDRNLFVIRAVIFVCRRYAMMSFSQETRGKHR